MESKCEESKYSEDKPIVELVNRNLMSDMICYAQSSFFVSQIENFKQEYRGLFQSECKSDDDHSLEQTNIFQKFQEMIDSLFEKFAISQNSSIDVLYENCRDAVENRFAPLFEEDENKWFVEDVLMSWMQFEDFVKMMKKSSSRFDCK